MAKVVIYKSMDNQYRFRVLTENGEVIMYSEGFQSKEGCSKTIQMIKRELITEIVDISN